MSQDERLRILVVDDEEHLAAGLKLNFELEGIHAVVAHSAREAGQRILESPAFDAIVLDVMLPDVDGYAFCKSLRGAGDFTPVLMLTVRSGGEDRITGLESGADDYLGKPFEFRELLARVRSITRRRAWERATGLPTHDTLEFGEVRVNFVTHEVTVAGEAITLTSLELDLLRFLASQPGRVRSRDELLQHVWKLSNYPNTRTVDNFIMRLRRHFEPDPKRPRHFLSVRGAGYKFVR